MASIISAGTTSGTSLNLSGDTSGVLQLASNGTTTAVTIDTSQKVGISTTSPDSKLHVKSTVDNTTNGLTLEYDVGTAYKSRVFTRGNDLYLSADTGNTGGGILFQTAGGTDRAYITSGGNFQFNSGYGSVATAYGVRAWVNFNGSGGVTIRGSGNVTSVTRTQGGIYFVTFTNNMPDVNYCFTGSASVSPGNFGLVAGDDISDRTVSRTGTFYTVNTASVNNAADANNINIAIFR